MPHILKNKYLKITLEKPGENYNACRFDWTGQINQVELIDKFLFCTTEKSNTKSPNLYGKGLYNEFGINRPVGYDDCPDYDYFHKIGVGLIKKEKEETYNFFKNYTFKPATFKLSQISDTDITITTISSNYRGYAYQLIKNYKLLEKELIISYTLLNSGTKMIQTEEYTHNFIAFNYQKIDQHYQLLLKQPLNVKNIKEVVNPDNCIKINKNTINWAQTTSAEFYLSNLNENGIPNTGWKLFHSQLQVSISEEVNFIPFKFCIWGNSHVVSPELFIDIKLLPGETLQWQRKYKFTVEN